MKKQGLRAGALVAAMVALAGAARGQEKAAAPTPFLPVSGVVITYVQDHPQNPTVDEILSATRVRLLRDGTKWREPREGEAAEEVALSQLGQPGYDELSAGALAQVVFALRDEFIRRGIAGFRVDASSEVSLPVDEKGQPDLKSGDWGKDLRPQSHPDNPKEFRVQVLIASVSDVRTQAAGERIKLEDRLNNAKHDRIRRNSPVQPAGEGSAGDHLDRNKVNDYMSRLNRHPGRRVDAAVSEGEQPGQIVLDYLVNEGKPWTVYFQVANTGTEQTSEWRERFGFSHTQLTNHDDILNLDYVTAGFDAANALLGSYERPLGRGRAHVRVFGSWNEFTASDVGQAGAKFSGDGWELGAELKVNVLQRRNLFIDAVVGGRWSNVSVTDETFGGNLNGETDFFIASIGLRGERNSAEMSTTGGITLDISIPEIADTDQGELDQLGRQNTSDDWTVLKWEFAHSMFLEPLLNRASWSDVENGKPTLAHEVAISFRGQYAFDRRLVPTAEEVVGGSYTVRGYTESIAVGDSAYVASAEYRYHIPWGRRANPEPTKGWFGEPFRWVPQQPYGRADWDLIARGFVDAGQTFNSKRLSFEEDHTLVGVGVGLELVVRRNVDVRLDIGFPLNEVKTANESNDVGDVKFHFSATLSY
ncbi:MAG: ShlB/FhaC/HecB family hemolysin secretion/activation protein [Phycisphaerae bacterium]|nr:ShlB/FhaC/HecB family hemolysin secretion/activation protein [Phycisphaerae bacterium]